MKPLVQAGMCVFHRLSAGGLQGASPAADRLGRHGDSAQAFLFVCFFKKSALKQNYYTDLKVTLNCVHPVPPLLPLHRTLLTCVS